MPAKMTAFMLSALLVVVACSGGGNLSGSLDQDSKGKDKSSASATDPNSGNGDSENAKSTPPVQVSGAFLASVCDFASPADGFQPQAGQDIYACAIRTTDGKKYGGPVAIHSLTIAYVKDPTVSASLNATAVESRWHTYFYLPAAERGQVKSYRMAGAIGTNSFDMTYVPTREDMAAAAALAALNAASGAPCAPTSNKTLAGLYPYTMDVPNFQSRGLLASTAGAAPAAILKDDGGLVGGDTVALTKWSGTAFTSVIDGVAGAGATSQLACPSRWTLSFLDKSSTILNKTTGDLQLFTTPRTVPAGTVNVYVGFSEPSDKTYKDNESENAMLGGQMITKGALTTGGCSFTFHIVRSRCGQ